jgi:hypothetical protein
MPKVRAKGRKNYMIMYYLSTAIEQFIRAALWLQPLAAGKISNQLIYI